MQYTLSILVENQAGVLSKISGLFSRRGFNIDSLAVGVTADPNVSRITIVANGDEYVVEQLEKQLNKVIPVIKVKRLNDGEFISRELILIKVHCAPSKRAEIIKTAEIMQAHAADERAHRIAEEHHREAGEVRLRAVVYCLRVCAKDAALGVFRAEVAERILLVPAPAVAEVAVAVDRPAALHEEFRHLVIAADVLHHAVQQLDRAAHPAVLRQKAHGRNVAPAGSGGEGKGFFDHN